mgnify:CR=1 FL=1
MTTNHFLGFTSITDLFRAIFGDLTRYNMKTLLLFSLFLTAVSFFEFIENWFWSPAWTILLFWAVFTLDFVSASTLSVQTRRKNPSSDEMEGFSTRKATRFVVSIICATGVLVIAFLISKAAQGFGMDDSMVSYLEFFPVLAYWTWLSVSFISACRHLAELGVIPKPIANILIKYIDVHKNNLPTSTNKN